MQKSVVMTINMKPRKKPLPKLKLHKFREQIRRVLENINNENKNCNWQYMFANIAALCTTEYR
jgi:hypothetical protein